VLVCPFLKIASAAQGTVAIRQRAVSWLAALR
jgi:hypothetical protein